MHPQRAAVILLILGEEHGRVIWQEFDDEEIRIITRAMAEQRMLEKLTRSLIEDIAPLLPAGVRFNDDDAMQAFERVWRELIVRIKGDGWKLTGKVLEELRTKKYPGLLSR